MRTDEELERLLAHALAVADREPPPDRVTALRAEAAAAARRRHARPPWWAIAAAISLLVVPAGVVGWLVGRSDGEPSGVSSGLREFAGPLVDADGSSAGTVDVAKIGEGRLIRIDVDQLTILPKGEYYEVWFVAPGDSAATPNRISAGTFHPDEQGRVHVTMFAAVDPSKFPTISITAEPADGNPAPTGPEVLRAEIG